MNTDDYTQDLFSVMAQELYFPKELKAADKRRRAEAWMGMNPEAIGKMEERGSAMHNLGLRVSAKYLVEVVRNEYPGLCKPLRYMDEYGEKHAYRIDNEITPYIGRYFKALHPEWGIITKQSQFDKEVAA